MRFSRVVSFGCLWALAVASPAIAATELLSLFDGVQQAVDITYEEAQPSCDATQPNCNATQPSCDGSGPSCGAPADCSGLSGCVCGDCNPVADCCQSECCCCRPTWTASVGAIFLSRARRDTGTIIGPNPVVPGASFSRGNDFDFNTRRGIDVYLARRLANGDAIEGRYFGVDDISATQQFNTPGNFIGAGFVGPANIPITGTYTSQLNSAEINYRHQWTDRIALLGGFRYVRYNDSLSYGITTIARGVYAYDNDLYGGQLGADIALLDPTNAFQINVIGKAGIYENNFQGGNAGFLPPGNQVNQFGRGDDGSAFVGDLLIVGSYQVTCHMALRAGYQMLWLDNIALSGDNAAVSQLNPGSLNTTTTRGEAFYHGAIAGVEFTW